MRIEYRTAYYRPLRSYHPGTHFLYCQYWRHACLYRAPQRSAFLLCNNIFYPERASFHSFFISHSFSGHRARCCFCRVLGSSGIYDGNGRSPLIAFLPLRARICPGHAGFYFLGRLLHARPKYRRGYNSSWRHCFICKSSKACRKNALRSWRAYLCGESCRYAAGNSILQWLNHGLRLSSL